MNEKQIAEYIAGELLGKPHKIGADGPKEYDCYGVTRAVQWRCFDIFMAGVERADVGPHGLARRLLAPEVREEWVEVKNGRHGDIMIMGNIDGRDYHMGVRLRIGQQHVVIHTEYHTDSGTGAVVVEDVSTLSFRGYHKIRYFRHKSRI